MRFKDRLFDEYVRVVVSPLEKISIMEKPEIVDEVMPNPELLLQSGIDVTTTRSNEDYIVERLMGAPMQTGDTEDDNFSSKLRAPNDLPIHEIVEIFYISGGIRFSEPQGVVTVMDVCEGYLVEYEEDRKYDMNLPPVPEEDLEKLEYVALQLRPYANKLRTMERYSDEWMSLLAGSSGNIFAHNPNFEEEGGFYVQADASVNPRQERDETPSFGSLASVYGFTR